MNRTELPKNLKTVISNENTDFIVFATKKQPLSKSIGTIFFAIAWLTLPLIMAYLLFKPLFVDENSQLSLNKTLPKIWENIGSKGIPALFVLLFVFIGFTYLISGIISLFKKGGYYVGTETKLIHYKKNKIEYFDWEQFTGGIKVNLKKNEIILELRRGKMVKKKKGPDTFIPDSIYLCGIKKVLVIEKACRERIKENDPTPSIKTT